MSMFCCLYDRGFVPLGNWTQHVCESWSLKRKAYEQDELELSCRGWENSASACFVGLHEQDGTIKYVAFCGIPYTKDGMTEVTGIDCRTIFNQTIYVDYSALASRTAEALYAFLLQGVFEKEGIDLGISYSIDVSDLSLIGILKDDTVDASREIRNVWDEIQRLNAIYDVVVESSVSASGTGYALTFTAKRVISARSIGLRDFDYEAELDSNAANHAIAIGLVVTEDDQGGTVEETRTRHYWLLRDNTVAWNSTGELPASARFPVITETFEDAEDFSAAAEEAISLLNGNRFQDRVTIDLNGLLGKTLEDLNFTYFGVLYGYNPADPDTAKRLPVSAISEDSEGNRSIEFGRLSEYWFLD